MLKKYAAQRGGNWNNGAHNGLFAVNSNNSPGNVNNDIGFRGIPFTDGVRDYGCGKHYQINSTSPGIPVAHRAEYGKGSGEVVGRQTPPNPPRPHSTDEDLH
jgi:hypothetical protein